MKGDRALPPLKPKARPKRRASSPGFDVRAALYYVIGLDLTEIEGVSELTALTVISEIGPGVSRFATAKKFCSWLGLCPQWQKSGGRVKSSRTRRGVNRAAQALRLAAQSLHHSQGALDGFLRRMKGRLGTQAALTATAHKLARIVYLALKHGMAYVRRSQEEYEAQMKDKQLKALRRKARQLGLEVVEKPSVSGAPGSRSRCRDRGGQEGISGRGPDGRGEQQGRARKTRRSDSSLAAAGERARPGEPGREITSVRWASWLGGGGSLQPRRMPANTASTIARSMPPLRRRCGTSVPGRTECASSSTVTS